MADYDLEAKITADASGYEAGVKKAEKASKKLSTSVSKVIQGLGKNGLVGALGAVGLASSGLSATLGSVVKIARKVSETINECTNAYKSQLIAEKALDTAIQNNPFVTGESSKALLQFASDMQKVSNYGDDELIPMMTNLISLGRTEAETMQIMSVAMDMSAGMGISLDSAITQLNATLNGNIGRLGQQNAELKDLTEEELKQGKAVEILGEKFKGLSSATADTSKQLQNIKGDFKEALGQFTLPSSDMWNKFWSGFYEKGIEIIKKLDEFLDTAIVGEKLADSIETQLKKMKKGGNKEGYVGEALSVLTDRELELITKYLEKQKKRNANEELILKVAKEQASSRAYLDKVEKQYLEDLAEEKRLKEEAEAREKELAELRKKQAEEEAERQKQLAIQKEKEQELLEEWQNKLFSIRIENLERQREREVENGKLTEEQKAEVAKYYGDQILNMRLQQIEKEREKELNAENVTEESRLAINLYYDNKITQAKQEEEKKRYKAKEEELKKEEEAEKQSLTIIVKVVQESTKKIGDTFKKMSNTIKDVFSKIGNFVKNAFDKTKNIFTKLFDFNVDDALNALLKVEDAILTFFVETLPKLPSFFESAFSSVLKTIKSLIDYIDWGKVAGFLTSIINTFVNYAPEIVSGIVEIFTNLVTTISNVLVENAPQIVNALGQMFFTIIEALPALIENFINVIGTFISEIGRYITENGERLAQDLSNIVHSIVEGITNFIKNGGWKNLLNALLTIQKAIEKAVMDNIDDLVDSIIEALPDLVNMLIESIVSASKTLAKVVKPLIKLILAIIEALIQVLFSDEVIDASLDAVMELLEVITTEAVPGIVRLIIRVIPQIIKALVKSIPKILKTFAVSIGQSFKSIGEIFYAVWDEIFSNPYLWQVLNGVADNISNFFKGIGDTIWNVFSTIGGNLGTAFSDISGAFGEMFSNMGKGLWYAFDGAINNIKNALSNFGNWVNDIWNNITRGASWAGEQLKNGFEWAINGIKGFFEGLATKVSEIFNKIGDGIKWAINGIIWTVNQVIAGINSVVGWTGIKINQIGYLAKGTNNAQKGLYLVGEAGPELVQFNGGERVLNNRNTNKALSEMGSNSGNTFNVTFNNLQDTTAFAMMNQLKQYNRQMAINGVI